MQCQRKAGRRRGSSPSYAVGEHSLPWTAGLGWGWPEGRDACVASFFGRHSFLLALLSHFSPRSFLRMGVWTRGPLSLLFVMICDSRSRSRCMISIRLGNDYHVLHGPLINLVSFFIRDELERDFGFILSVR